jgi:hypothetical protein
MNTIIKKLNVFFSMFTVTIVITMFSGMQPLEAMGLGTVDICHWVNEDVGFKHIKINSRSQQAHIDNHGDKMYIEGENCNGAAPPWRFAIAFINVDGLPGYDDTVDILIARLDDTNGNLIVDAGDTVVTNSYPLNFDPCGGSFTQCLDVRAFKVNTQIITEINEAKEFSINVVWKKMRYRWFDADFFEQYSEIDDAAANDGVRGAAVELEDEISAGSAEGDKIIVGDRSPSRPSSEEVDISRSMSDVDDKFLDVEVNLPNL